MQGSNTRPRSSPATSTPTFHWVSHWLPLQTGRHQARALERLVRSYDFDTKVRDSGATHRYIDRKLDGIYTRGFETRRFATTRAEDVSDHLALWATVRSTRQAPAVRQPTAASVASYNR